MKSTENFISRATQQKTSDNQLIFEINSLQQLSENNPDYFRTPKSMDEFTIIWMIKGNGVYHIDLQSNPFHDNSILFIKPGQMHHHELIDKPVGYSISF